MWVTACPRSVPERSSLRLGVASSSHQRCKRSGSPPTYLQRLARRSLGVWHAAGGRLSTNPGASSRPEASILQRRRSLGEIHARLSRHGNFRSGARSTGNIWRLPLRLLRGLDGRVAAPRQSPRLSYKVDRITPEMRAHSLRLETLPFFDSAVLDDRPGSRAELRRKNPLRLYNSINLLSGVVHAAAYLIVDTPYWIIPICMSGTR